MIHDFHQQLNNYYRNGVLKFMCFFNTNRQSPSSTASIQLMTITSWYNNQTFKTINIKTYISKELQSTTTNPVVLGILVDDDDITDVRINIESCFSYQRPRTETIDREDNSSNSNNKDEDVNYMIHQEDDKDQIQHVLK